MAVKKEFVSIKGNTIEIKLPTNLHMEAFENTLKSCYHLSLKKAYTTVRLNFSFVEWVDVLQLSMLSLWILELLNRNKEISVSFPPKNDLIKFF